MHLLNLSSAIDHRYHRDYSDDRWCDHITASHAWSQNSSHLTVTVGESWTNYFGTRDITRDEFWGLDLAHHTGTDWLNIASPGFSNHWMLENLLAFGPYILGLPYSQITVIVCLTELGRELPDSKVFNYDFISELAPRLASQGLDSVLDYQVEKTQDKLRQILNCYQPRARVLIAANFSDILERMRSDIVLGPALMTESWCQVLARGTGIDAPPLVPMMFDITIEKHRDFLMDQELFDLDSAQVHEWLLQHIDNSHRLLDWFARCPCIRPDSRKHPNKVGRDIWVQHVRALIDK